MIKKSVLLCVWTEMVRLTVSLNTVLSRHVGSLSVIERENSSKFNISIFVLFSCLVGRNTRNLFVCTRKQRRSANYRDNYTAAVAKAGLLRACASLVWRDGR